MPDGMVLSPIYPVDNGRLHLEACYNHENLNTFTTWVGYNFTGGNYFQYTITPMVGGLKGNLKGLSPGLEVDFDFKSFNSSSQYFFDLKTRENDFYYNWTDFTYAPLYWLSFGVSLQRTRLYQKSLETQYGGMLGFVYKSLALLCYWYNPLNVDQYLVLSLSINIPEQ